MSLLNSTSPKGISRRQLLRGGLGLAMASLAGFPGAVVSGNDARVIRHVHTNARKVCLTYDDLWSEYYTLQIGREYARRNIKLTFFPAGLAVANNLNRPNPGFENLYPRLRDMGHEFGCHLFTHRVIQNFGVQQLIDEELEPALREMRRALGLRFRPVGIRPPYGHLTDALKETSARYGFPLILWGLDSQDAICTKQNEDKPCECTASARFESFAGMWGPMRSEGLCKERQCDQTCVQEILQSYERYLRPGTIILHHSIKASFAAIEPTLKLLRAWNMQPVPLSELLALAP